MSKHSKKNLKSLCYYLFRAKIKHQTKDTVAIAFFLIETSSVWSNYLYTDL